MEISENDLSYEISKMYLHPSLPALYREDLKENWISEEFMAKTLYELFDSGNFKGDKLLDIGSGPTVHRIATLSKHFDEITLSDYSPVLIESLNKWLKEDPEATDWTPWFESVARLEGFSDLSSGVKEIQSRIRKKVKSVVRCDVLKNPMTAIDIKDVDMVMTCYCLELACPDITTYKDAVKKLGSFVKPGGHLLMLTLLGLKSGVSWKGTEFKSLSLTAEDVEHSLEEAGFVKLEWFYHKQTVKREVELDGVSLILGKKQ